MKCNSKFIVLFDPRWYFNDLIRPLIGLTPVLERAVLKDLKSRIRISDGWHNPDWLNVTTNDLEFSLQKGFAEVSKRFQEEQKNMNDLVQKAQQIKDALAGMD